MQPAYQITFYWGEHFEHLYANWSTEVQAALKLFDDAQTVDEIRVRKWNGNDYIDLPEDTEWSLSALRNTETSFTRNVYLNH